MLNRVDKLMLSTLLVLTLLSGWYLWPLPTNELQEVVELKEIPSHLPDFGSIVDVKSKKSAFFDYVLPMVERENQVILQNRQQLLELSAKTTLSEDEAGWVKSLAKRYRLKSIETVDRALFETLLPRVDIIPASLALAQSANESAWGTSRFATQGNNFFGQWCFSPGCGIVPSGRPEGKTYEVQKFETVYASVQAYMHNLNTNHSYQSLRAMRESNREKRLPVTGVNLAQGLGAYSIRGDDYIQELIAMINSNELIQYDDDDQG
ncbi:glucosaminidase domain-containing protein [uncultured Endozoicomonas sp.]|uniref:glucosaminidase domain-containing protein n=1 Tax=uncultured Endozoicomonas sp. TaxID=432652 RepID=UPI00261FF733|nr:glucosaminidase domain-containing protein [uncultured Endozoicomonas sp.]